MNLVIERFPHHPFPYVFESYESMTMMEMIYILWIYSVGFIIAVLFVWALVKFGKIGWRIIWSGRRNHES